MNIYVEIAAGGLLGAFIHTAVKVNAINQRLNTTNYRQVFTEYWKTDWALFLLSLIGIGTIVFVSSEWLNLQDTDSDPHGLYELLQYKISQFAKTTAVVLGYCVDSAVNAFLGGTERKLIKKAKDEGLPMDQIIKNKGDQ